jgi:hypothetical protein
MGDFKGFLIEKTTNENNIVEPKQLSYNHISHMLTHGKIIGHATEKTHDGKDFTVGYDNRGFYTKAPHTGKMRMHGDYEMDGLKVNGEDHDPEKTNHLDNTHRDMMSNPNLISYLQQHQASNGGDSALTGSLYYKQHASPSESGGLHFDGQTSKDQEHMGSAGMFVVHSEKNKDHDLDALTQLGDHKINIDHDTVPNSAVGIPAKDLQTKLESINPKMIDRNKLNDIKSQIGKRIQSHVDSLPAKWSKDNHTAGHVFHPYVQENQ